MAERATGFSTPHLLVDAVAQIAGLIRTEVRLARAELSEKAAQAINGIGLLTAAMVLLFAALLLFLQGVVGWLVVGGMQPHWAAFLVGAAVGIVGLVLLLTARSALRISNLTPDRTFHQVGKDIAAAKEIVP